MKDLTSTFDPSFNDNPFRTENPPENTAVERESQAIHEDMDRRLRAFILEGAHPCVGAQSAFRKNEYRLKVYSELGTSASAQEMARDLYDFIQEQKSSPPSFATFLAAFRTPVDMTELEFEARLWNQLNELDRLSRKFFDWDPEVSSEPDDPDFSFSFGGRAFYVVGMHRNSARMARSFEFPLLAFNLHSQFEALRTGGLYERMRETIRKRDKDLQGSINGMLRDFGQESEARQYSGRQFQGEWKCPFHRGR